MPYPDNADYYNRAPDEYPPASFQRETVNLRVKSLSMIATGTYNEQFSRAYATSFNQDNKNELYETLNTSYHTYQQRMRAGVISQSATPYEVTPELIAGVTSSFINPSAKPEAPVAIAGGWSNQRARFIMEIAVTRGIGQSEYVMVGYTDHYGIASNGDVDPRMEFFINAIFELRKQTVMTPYGAQETTIVVNASQLLANSNWSGDINSNTQHRMRPEDVIARISVSHIPALASGSVEVIDARNTNTATPVKSSFAHANPTNYLAAILGGITSGQHQAALTNRHGHVYDLAANTVADNKVARDPFLKAMSNIRSSTLSNKFTFRELAELDPGVHSDQVTTIYKRDQAQLLSATNRPGEDLHQAGSTSPWYGSDHQTWSAAKIVNALPHLMIDLLLRSCTIHSTNKVGGIPVTVFSHVVGLVKGVDMTPYAEQLKQQFTLQLLNDITFNNSISYEMTISANVMGEIWVSMHLERHDPADYVAPAFANSLSSPVTTRNLLNLGQLAKDFDTLQQEVFQPGHIQPQENVLWQPPPSGRRY